MNNTNNFGTGFSNINSRTDVRTTCPSCGVILKKQDLVKVEHATERVFLGLFPKIIVLCKDCVERRNRKIKENNKQTQSNIPPVLQRGSQ